jgi:hypothetical protein
MVRASDAFFLFPYGISKLKVCLRAKARTPVRPLAWELKLIGLGLFWHLVPKHIFKDLIFCGFEATNFSCSTPPTLII